MTTNTGGPAFPSFEFQQNYNQMMAVGGMSLRDYFAAKAMQSLVAGNSTDAQQISQAAYIVADAMMKAREA